MDGDAGEILLDEIVCEIPEKYIQWRLTVNVFREKEYLHLRKYFLDFDGEYVPSRDGACIPVNIQILGGLVSALLKLLKDAEDPEKMYIEKIMQDKLRLNLEYLSNRSLISDIGIIFKTISRIL